MAAHCRRWAPSVWEWNRDFPGNNLRHKLQDKLMAKLQHIFKANVMIIQTSENLHSENRPLIRLLSSVDLSDIISMIAFSNSSCELQPLAMPWRNTDARDLTSCDKMLPPTICLVLSLASRRWMQDPVAHMYIWPCIMLGNIFAKEFWSSNQTNKWVLLLCIQLFLFEQPFAKLVYIECEKLLLCSALMLIVCNLPANSVLWLLTSIILDCSHQSPEKG